jgi:hypothetical protein
MPTVEVLHRPLHGPIPPGLQRLHDYLLERFPSTRSGGIYNPASVTNSGSPSAHQVPQALDIMCDQTAGAALIRWCVAQAEALNLQQAIAWHEIVTAARWDEGIRVYTPGDHADGNGHLHLHIGWEAALNWRPWYDTNPDIDDDEVIDLTPEQDQMLRDLHAYMSSQKEPAWRAQQQTSDLHAFMVAIKAKLLAWVKG